MSHSSVDCTRVSDPVLRSQSLPYVMTLPVLGIETSFETNSLVTLGIIEESLGVWRHLPRDGQSATDALRIRIVVRAGSEADTGHSPVSHTSAAEKRLIIQTAGSIGYVDPVRRESVAYVTADLVADFEHFRVSILEAMTFALLCCFDRYPVHAAAIAGGRRTLLLAGGSGSGKSTLAYLAHTAGIRVLGDDHVWVQIDPVCRIWGAAQRVRLLPDSPSSFPDVQSRGIATTANGKEKLVVPVGSPTDPPTLFGENPVVCILARGSRAMLEPMAASDVETELRHQLSPGFDRYPERHDAVARTVAAGGGWRLTVSPDPHDALPMLSRMLDEE